MLHHGNMNPFDIVVLHDTKEERHDKNEPDVNLTDRHFADGETGAIQAQSSNESKGGGKTLFERLLSEPADLGMSRPPMGMEFVFSADAA